MIDYYDVNGAFDLYKLQSDLLLKRSEDAGGHFTWRCRREHLDTLCSRSIRFPHESKRKLIAQTGPVMHRSPGLMRQRLGQEIHPDVGRLDETRAMNHHRARATGQWRDAGQRGFALGAPQRDVPLRRIDDLQARTHNRQIECRQQPCFVMKREVKPFLKECLEMCRKASSVLPVGSLASMVNRSVSSQPGPET